MQHPFVRVLFPVVEGLSQITLHSRAVLPPLLLPFYQFGGLLQFLGLPRGEKVSDGACSMHRSGARAVASQTGSTRWALRIVTFPAVTG